MVTIGILPCQGKIPMLEYIGSTPIFAKRLHTAFMEILSAFTGKL
jgi:hypothetical protein